MKIRQKMMINFLIISLLIWCTGYLAVYKSREALEESIGQNSVILAKQTLDKIDRNIYHRIEDFKVYTENLVIRESVLKSNQEFERLDNIQQYIDKNDKDWLAAEKKDRTAFMQNIIQNEMSEELRAKTKFYEAEYGYAIFSEVFITNKYGANSAQTNKTSDYYQADEDWWQKAKKEGLYVADVKYDESAGVYSVDICLRIDDNDGKFLGVMKVVLNIEGVIRIIKELESSEESIKDKVVYYKGHAAIKFKLVAKSRKIIYSTEEFNFLQDLSPNLASQLNTQRKHGDYFIAAGVNPGESEALFAYAHSRGYKRFKSLGWILLVEHETEKIFNPVIKLKNQLMVISIIVTALAILIGLFISYRIYKPIATLKNAALLIGRGELDTEFEVESKDEIGQLSESFKEMVANLRSSMTSIGNLNKEIAERKKAEKTLRENEKRFLDITHSMADWVWEVDKNGKFTYVSDTVKNILGYSSEELIGRTPFEIMPEKEAIKISEIFLKIFSKSGPIVDLENWNLTKDGTEVCILTNGVPVINDDGELKGYRGVDKDISNQKKLEAERLQFESQLLQAQKMESIGNLAGGIAHDFNNILSSVIGFTELSLDEVEKGTHLEDNLQEVYTAGKRAKDLVRQILAFARQSEEELKPIQVDTIATEVLKFIRSSIPATIEIKQNIESDSLIMGNATQVHQILMNLFTNAAYAMEDKGGLLEVSLKDAVADRGVNRENLDLKPGNYIEIMVSDTGAGIAPEIIGSIFDPYFTTKGPGEGTGMGLAMIHGIIENYGGKIFVDSKPEQGTRFTIYLPVTGKRQEHRPYEPEMLPTGKERILFVDDEAPIAKIGDKALERLGYTVSIRTSSIEALALFRTKPNDFDLVITDMTMPNMTGDSLAIELMKIRPDIPVILCTGYSKKISDESASEMGIKAFLYKPIVKAYLAKTVRKVLDEAKDSTGALPVC